MAKVIFVLYRNQRLGELQLPPIPTLMNAPVAPTGQADNYLISDPSSVKKSADTRIIIQIVKYLHSISTINVYVYGYRTPNLEQSVPGFIG